MLRASSNICRLAQNHPGAGVSRRHVAFSPVDCARSRAPRRPRSRAHAQQPSNSNLRHLSLAEAQVRCAAASSQPSSSSESPQNEMLLRQLYDTSGSCTYTYLLGCTRTREACLIDPVREMVERDLKLLDELGLTLVYILNTHVHEDHVSGSAAIKDIYDDRDLPLQVQSVISWASGAEADFRFQPGTSIRVGDIELEGLPTPGHSSGCLTFATAANGGAAFTGDALHIRGAGRADLPASDPALLYRSVRDQIFALPGHYMVYPGHDYSGCLTSTVEEERTFNDCFSEPEDQACARMLAHPHPPLPPNLDEIIARNMSDGYKPL